MEDLRLYDGRPMEQGERLDKEMRVYDLLDKLHIPYKRVDHEAAYTIEACAAVDELLQIHICKNLFLCNRQETKFYLLMIPGDKKFKTKDISEQIGSARLSFAKESYMEEFLDITPGSVSVLGLMNDHDNRVQLLIDTDLLAYEEFGCHPCMNTTSLKMKMRDLLDKFMPAVKHEAVFVTLPDHQD